jgi:hypothetical protein
MTDMNSFMNKPSQKVTIKKMAKTVESDFIKRVTTNPASKLPGDASSGYNGVDSKSVSSYQPGGDQAPRMPFKSIRNHNDM